MYLYIYVVRMKSLWAMSIDYKLSLVRRFFCKCAECNGRYFSCIGNQASQQIYFCVCVFSCSSCPKYHLASHLFCWLRWSLSGVAGPVDSFIQFTSLFVFLSQARLHFNFYQLESNVISPHILDEKHNRIYWDVYDLHKMLKEKIYRTIFECKNIEICLKNAACATMQQCVVSGSSNHYES